MTGLLLDTSGYAAARRGLPEVVELLQQADRIAVNPVVVGELLAGFRKSARRAQNERELDRFLASPRVEVVPIDRDTSEPYATIVDTLRGRGTPIPTNDLWIAATAMQHGLTVVTTDARLTRVPQILVRRFAVA